MSTETGTRAHWPLGAPPTDYVLGHVRAVLPDRILDDALVAVRDGRIAEVGPHRLGLRADVDGQGLLCLPGLVDVHSDGLEKERLPRPGAELPIEFALLSFEGKLRAAAVTTVFHGAGFEESAGRGLARTVATAQAVCRVVDERGVAPVDHRILHRLDVRSPEGLAALRNRLAQLRAAPAELAGAAPARPSTEPPGSGPARPTTEPPGSAPLLVSHEDHTPGQGQYADRRYYERYLVGARGMTAEQATRQVDELVSDRAGRLDVRAQALGWLGEQARAGQIRLLGHDPSSPAEIDELARRGGAVAEFPTTLDAARAAAERGMPVVMGAPNVLRGGSHNGNASGRELIGHGLVTALASDYLPSGLLASAFVLAADGVATLPAAIALVTEGAARVGGLTDRGRLAPGLRADLALIDPGSPWPVVRSVLTASDTLTEGAR